MNISLVFARRILSDSPLPFSVFDIRQSIFTFYLLSWNLPTTHQSFVVLGSLASGSAIKQVPVARYSKIAGAKAGPSWQLLFFLDSVNFLTGTSVSFLYSRKERLSTRFEYLSVRECGSSFRYNHFWLQLKANNLEYSRLGVIASKRVGNAVKRNQAKRIIRELFRKYRSHILVPSDVVVLARSSIIKLSFSELEQLFIKALRKSSCHLWKIIS